jgi:dTDP-4-amino-4,6-dideoxygalactose transaminase
VAVSSCTMAITMVLEYLGDSLGKCCRIPSMIPPVVCNAIIKSGNRIAFYDDPNWVGSSYKLCSVGDCDVIDSAHEVISGAFDQCDSGTRKVVLYSFYPTKPVGGMDGGMICTNDESLARSIRHASMNGAVYAGDSWDRLTLFPGWKAYMSRAQAQVAMDSLRNLADKNSRLWEIYCEYTNLLFAESSFFSQHIFSITLPPGDGTRKYLSTKLKSEGIQTGLHYQSLKGTDPYQHYDEGSDDCMLSYDISNRRLSLPYHTDLTKKDIEKICRVVNEHVS